MYSPKQFSELLVRAVKNGDSSICRFYYYQNNLLFLGSSEVKAIPIIFAYRGVDVSPLITELSSVAEFHMFPTPKGVVIHCLTGNKSSCPECQQHVRQQKSSRRR